MAKRKQEMGQKKTAQRKSTARRERVAKTKTYLNYLTGALFAVGILIGFGYYLGLKTTTKPHPASSTIHPKSMFQTVKSQHTEKIRYDEAGLDIIGKLMKKQDERRERKGSQSKHTPPATASSLNGKPRLVIIIDDVSQAWQIKAIKKLGYPVTPSIFPPSEMGRHSNRLAKGLKHFMIHLPMESGSAKMNRMQGMLFVSDSAAKMKARAQEMRRLFPHGKYINNHTGSVFTSNYKAMKKMYGYLRNEGFVFVDSRTAGSTKVRKIAHEFGDRYIVRDIFIDNTQSIPYIRKQLKKAVRKARKRGFAITIGHPHKITLQTLASAKKLFKGIDLVYIDELY